MNLKLFEKSDTFWYFVIYSLNDALSNTINLLKDMRLNYIQSHL